MSVILFSIYLLIHQLPEIKSEKTNYLGCFIDGGSSDRLINGYKEYLYANNSPDVCIKLCHSKGFAIAALQYEYECFCGNSKPSFKVQTEESDCNKECRGDKSKKCGGDWRLSVYETGLTVLHNQDSEKELEYIGCFIDDNPSNRFLNNRREVSSNSLTPFYCSGLCYRSGNLYAGLQNGNECYCGDRHPLSELKVVDSECNSKCSGDDQKKCGGAWRLSIYSTSITDFPVDGKYLGCFEDSANKRILNGKKFSLHSTNTPRRCANLCFVNNYEYAGLQYNFECFCGNDKIPRLTTSDNDCRLNCPGDSTERCGGYWRLAVYRTGFKCDSALEFNNVQYLGCFKDVGSHSKRLFKGYLQEMFGKLTPELCIDVCRSKGFHYSATQFKYECFCDNKRPSNNLQISNEKCNLPCAGDSNQKCGGEWALSVYNTGLKGPVEVTTNYVGCFKDETEPKRLLKYDKYTFNKQNIHLCLSHCLFQGYTLAGLQWRKECFCGDVNLSAALKVSESNCSYICPGDSSQFCGGDLKLSIYKTGILLKDDIERNYIGCFDSTHKILRSYKIDLETNSPQRCIGVCGALGHSFAGLENGVQCFCGYLSPGLIHSVNNSECNIGCPGDGNRFCGGNWRLSVYSTEFGMDKGDENDNLTPCISTATRVNGMTPCKNEVLLYETFDGELSRDMWQNTVKISDLPDENFVVFSNDKRNSFTQNGKLHIKPSLLPDEDIAGCLSLIGCTGEVGTPQCTMHASSYRIIPPVISAQISTKNTFYFRYGIIEIIAKFPTGDWIIPELYLEPKYLVYGPYFISGRIKIASAFGNENLVTKDGEIIGSNCLESGIVIGDSKIMKRKITKCVSEGWNKNFHNYTLIWSPDDIQLVIDGEYQPSLMTGVHNSSLCTAIGQGNLCSTLWSSSSKIAPFDKDFYIKLGVTIGGNRVFPDNITTNNGKMKPWKNFEVKSLVKFWNKTNEWYPTWSDPTLQIESIKVTAL